MARKRKGPGRKGPLAPGAKRASEDRRKNPDFQGPPRSYAQKGAGSRGGAGGQG